MRIGLFTDSYLPRMDGIAISVESFRLGLEALGHTVYVFCPKRPEPFVEPNDRIYRFPSVPSMSYEQYRDTFPFTLNHYRKITSLKLDVIHTFTQTQIGLFGTFVARRNHIPLVTTCSADVDMINDYKRFRFGLLPMVVGITMATQSFMSRRSLQNFFIPQYPLSKWLRQGVRVAAAFYNDQCDATTVPSLKTFHSVAPFMRKKPVILPCGTDLSLVPKDEKGIRSKYSLPEDLVLFVSASRLVREKRIDFVIKAFAKLSASDQEKSGLVIIGDGPDLGLLKNLVKDLGISQKVIFVGRVDHIDVLKIVKACDIYVHASLRETQGLVLNEAAACGKPLIMIDREANTILHEGENGLFADNTVTDYGEKMAKLLHDKELRKKFGEKSQAFAKATDLKEAAKPLVALYGSLLHN